MRVPGLRPDADPVGGLVFFGRMLDKIRLHAAGRLPADFHRGTGFDGRLCTFLRVEYADVAARTLAGGTDEEILEWCYARGRRPAPDDVQLFNAFLSKRGWRDDASEDVAEQKQLNGWADRADIQTYFDLHRADEA